ncbi:hypothetical protein UFOVP325_43 [uncultured Caudovirales phage]|jgi:hypothetical protein|uniref:Uncharacterized protein n=1 Tax=uncultured Caudovirales phage TaxID=2100421 RepID=A0A6J5MR43_9CAUD|nr:hypothetical protein UFOVP325_43 [uncultured Caudovirales phage]CAB4147653.1 hypothetical protein UFOVP430_38 [uncultured Caudovirales phage]
MERTTWVDYIWKDEIDNDMPETRAMVVILNNPELYEDLHKHEGFDERVWFYFQDEAEFKRAFDPNNDEFEFLLTYEDTTGFGN